MIIAEAKPRGRGRPRSFDTAAAVQKAALVFWERGYEGTSVEDLTVAMGITTQSLYAAFGSKAELYRQSLAWYEREVSLPVRRALAEEPDVSLAIERTLEDLACRFTGDSLPSGCMHSTAMLRCAAQHRELAAHAASLRAQTCDAVKTRLDRGVKERQLAKRTKTAVLAGFINALVVGMSVAAQDGATEADLFPYAALAVASIDRLRVDR